MAVIREHRPDLLVADLSLGPGPGGIDVAIAARRSLPELAIVILSGYADPRLLDPALPPAPHGVQYVTKASITDTNVLARAIGRAMARQVDSRPHSTPHVNLSETQVDLLRMVAEGSTNREIAERRGSSTKAVEAALQRLTRRLGIAPSPATNQRIALTNAYWQLTGQHRPARR
jgi:DNA-binding NarL/FixJ family response regulator